MSWSARRTIWLRRWNWRKSDIDAAIVDLSLGRDNSYPLIDALIARDLPFALATGYGPDGVEPNIGIDRRSASRSNLRRSAARSIS